MDFRDLTIRKFHQAVINKEFSAEEAVKTYLSNIKKENDKICAYLSINEKESLEKARAIDKSLAEGQKISLLSGAPLAVKDNILIEGQLTTAASKILQNYKATYDATVIGKLKKAGAIFLGKTNLDEFAMGSSTENSAFKITKNPFDLKRVPGGSSGGSAAAVAADLALAALGSDTGGSIRQPAAFCGVVGLKPTYGAVSRFGLIAMASSLDQIGPITKSVEDAAIIFETIQGRDEFDSTSNGSAFNFQNLKIDKESLKNIKIGLPKEYFTNGLNFEARKEIEETIIKFKNLGFEFKEISLPHTSLAVACYYIIMPAEVSANLARYDGIRYSRINADKNADKRRSISINQRDNQYKSALEKIYFQTRGDGFGEEVKRRILLGTFVLSAGYYDAYYAQAQRVRCLIKEDFDRAFDKSLGGVDVILTPTTPTPSFKIGEKINDPLAMYLSDIFTVPVNLAGLPAISIPVKKYRKEQNCLPVGFQLIGKPFREIDILSVGSFYERESG